MKMYLVKITWYKPYPKEAVIRIGGSSLPVAVGRALRQWKKEGGQRVEKIKIEVEKL